VVCFSVHTTFFSCHWHEISQCILSHWSRQIPNVRINSSPRNTR
jgi:hypothetical protein